MTIYKELLQRVESGETFGIDFEKRTMKIGKRKIIDNGEYDTAKELINNPFESMDYVLNTIELLYCNYKYSLPSERSKSKYFKAYSMEDVPDDNLFTMEHRELAQARLEGFILCMILKGIFKWDELAKGKWFYQSVNDSDLIILKSWVENKNN